MENVPTPLETIFNISRGPQRTYTAKPFFQNVINLMNLINQFALFPRFGAIQWETVVARHCMALSTTLDGS